MNSYAKPVTYKIVSIPNDNSVVVNMGENIAKRGQVLEVYLPGKEVFDPDTKESLGCLDIVKAFLEVTVVYPKMCLCKNNRKHTLMSTMGSVAAGIRESLPVDLTEMTGELLIEDKEKMLRIGDLVREAIT